MSEPLVTAVPTPARAVDIDALYREHARTVARWALRLGGPAIDAEDVMQEVFLIAKRRLGTFTPGAKITTWLFRTTDKVVRGARRRLRVLRLLSLAPIGPASDRPSALELLERDETRRRVYRILDQLPERHRRVLILFELEGLSTQQIAELVETRAPTVRVWLHRARARFAELDEALGAGSGGR